MAEELKEYMLTTVDNPYNPFTQWDLWYNFDEKKGYCSCGYLDRVSATSDGFTDVENTRELNRAIDWIVKNDPLHIYRKVSEDSFDEIMRESNANKEEFEKYQVTEA